jgi:broad specificity phosphatase PhoE
MKWPKNITLVRHGQSAYNGLRKRKEGNPLYERFKRLYEGNDDSRETVCLAREVQKLFSLGVSDYDTPLTSKGEDQARTAGCGMRNNNFPLPDVIFASPYLRT